MDRDFASFSRDTEKNTEEYKMVKSKEGTISRRDAETRRKNHIKTEGPNRTKKGDEEKRMKDEEKRMKDPDESGPCSG